MRTGFDEGTNNGTTGFHREHARSLGDHSAAQRRGTEAEHNTNLVLDAHETFRETFHW